MWPPAVRHALAAIAVIMGARATVGALAPMPRVHHHPSRGPLYDARSCSVHWFKQRVDHFRPPKTGVASTWRQRYFICRQDIWENPGAPILFYCGNEADVELYVNATGLMWEHADKVGAALVFAEHRFFGKSLPVGRLQIPDNMHLLSSEQALADYAAILRHLRGMGGKYRPAAALGGSYGGMLATWLRIKYPAAVDGALAASAPVVSFLGLDPPYDTGSFGKAVTRDASSTGGGADACVDAVRSAWKLIFEKAKTTEGREELSTTFHLCPKSLVTNEGDGARLAGWLQSAMDFMAMGSFPYPSTYMLNGGGQLPAFPLRKMCARITEAIGTAPADRSGALLPALRDGVSLFYNYTGSPAAAAGCYDMSLTGNEETTKDGMYWDYLYCTDMLQPASRDGVEDMFWAQPFDLEAVAEGCRERWGVEAQPASATIQYGGWKALQASSNILFSNGALDPWAPGGVRHNISDTVLSIIIPDVGHHVDLFFADPADPPAVRAARAFEMQMIQSWLRPGTVMHEAPTVERGHHSDH